MTTKTEWEEYFELLNDRKPTAEEYAEAQKAGAFTTEDTVKTAVEAESKTVEKNFSETKEQVNEAYNKVKKHTGSYFKWFKERALNPTKFIEAQTAENTTYLWVSYVMTVLLTAGIFWNIVRRVIDAVLAVYKGYTGSTGTVPDIGGRILPPVFFFAFVTMAIIFMVGLPSLLLITRGHYQPKETLTKYLGWFPTAMIFALLGFLYSFVAPLPSTSQMSDISSLTSFFTVAYSPLLLLPGLAITIMSLGSYFLVQKTHLQDTKVDLIWWQLAQIIGTSVVLWFAVNFVILPMFNSFVTNSISSLSSARW
ncbi:hypothetical protein [Convivina intestini]|uniref:hypothetical protein n=1 Tax=Convivina intestini TaxID=1505726 RepID=UPI0020105D2C|nr:hypothetical protein [Convivina intestini]CAH1855836.1 hypothetical protein R078131_01282 [Convivina intestini]